MKETTQNKAVMSMDEFWVRRHESNAKALEIMRDIEFAEDLIILAREDATNGHMTGPVKATDDMLQDKFLSERIAVGELKQPTQDERIRPVDHGSESGLKAVIWSDEMIQV